MGAAAGAGSRSTSDACWIQNISVWPLARGSYIHSGQRAADGASSSAAKDTNDDHYTAVVWMVEVRSCIPCDRSGSLRGLCVWACDCVGERKVIRAKNVYPMGSE